MDMTLFLKKEGNHVNISPAKRCYDRVKRKWHRILQKLKRKSKNLNLSS
jgi:hypothetical protein